MLVTLIYQCLQLIGEYFTLLDQFYLHQLTIAHPPPHQCKFYKFISSHIFSYFPLYPLSKLPIVSLLILPFSCLMSILTSTLYQRFHPSHFLNTLLTFLHYHLNTPKNTLSSSLSFNPTHINAYTHMQHNPQLTHRKFINI